MRTTMRSFRFWWGYKSSTGVGHYSCDNSEHQRIKPWINLIAWMLEICRKWALSRDTNCLKIICCCVSQWFSESSHVQDGMHQHTQNVHAWKTFWTTSSPYTKKSNTTNLEKKTTAMRPASLTSTFPSGLCKCGQQTEQQQQQRETELNE